MRGSTPGDKSVILDPSSIEMSKEQYDKLMDVTVDMVRETILGKTDEMVPVLFVHYREFDEENGMFGDLTCDAVMIAGGFNDADTKYETLFNLGKKFYEDRKIPAAIFMGSEVWISLNPTEAIMPRDDPNRTEAVVISGCSIGRDCKSMKIIPIAKDNNGFIIASGPEPTYPEDGKLETFLLDQFYRGFFDKTIRKQQENEQPTDHHRR